MKIQSLKSRFGILFLFFLFVNINFVFAALEPSYNIIPEDYWPWPGGTPESPTYPDLSTITKQHPYLYFNSSELSALRTRWNTEQTIQSGCSYCLNEDYPIYYHIYKIRDNSDPGGKTYLYDKSVAASNAALIGTLESSSAFINRSITYLRNINNYTRLYSSSETAYRLNLNRIGVNTALVYDWVYNDINESERPEIENNMIELALEMLKLLNDKRSNNTEGMAAYTFASERNEMAAVIVMFALTIPDYHKDSVTFCSRWDNSNCTSTTTWSSVPYSGSGDINSQDIMEYGLNILFGIEPNPDIRENQPNSNPDYYNQHYFSHISRDGVEGLGTYYGHVFGITRPAFIAWDNTLDENILEELDNHGEAVIEMTMPNERLPRHDTGGYNWITPHIVSSYVADKYSSSDLKRHLYYWKSMWDGNYPPNDYTTGNYQDYGVYYLYKFTWIMFDNNIKQAWDELNGLDADEVLPKGDLSKIFPDGGQAVLRDGYGWNNTYMLVNAEHDIHDKTGKTTDSATFTIFAKNHALAVNAGGKPSGNFSGDVPSDFRSGNLKLRDFDTDWSSIWEYLYTSVSQNSFLVDDLGQRSNYDSLYNYDPAEFIDFFATDNFDYVDLKITYDDKHITGTNVTECSPAGHCVDFVGLGEPGGIDLYRSFLFPNKEYFIVIDQVKNADNPHTYNFVLHFGPDETGNLNLEANKAVWTYNSSVLEAHFVTPDVNFRTFNTGMNSYGRTQYIKADGTETNFITVLYPRYSNESSPAVTQLDAVGGKAGKVEHNGINEIVTLKEGSEVSADKIRTDAKISFTKYTNPLEYFFIKEGKYFVYDNVTYFNSSEDVTAVLNYSNYKISGRIDKLNGSIYNSIDIELYTETEPNNLSIGGVNTPFTYDAGVISFTTSAFGDLIINKIAPPGCVDNDGDSYGEGIDCLGADCDDGDASVHPPSDGMNIIENTTFCPGTYNLPNGITVGANHIVLDSNGAVLIGNHINTVAAIEISGRTNVLVRNSVIRNYEDGIGLLLDNSFITIENNNISNMTRSGIYLFKRNTNNTLKNNNLINNSRGIFLSYNSENNEVINNYMENNGVHHCEIGSEPCGGIRLDMEAKNNVIKDNTFINNLNGFSLRWVESNNITGNYVYNSALDGMVFDAYQTGSRNNSIWNNDFYYTGINIANGEDNYYCVDGIGNYYNNSEGPSCDKDDDSYYDYEDCDETNADINPGATEVCNGIDDDCDTITDNSGNALCDDGAYCNGAETCEDTFGCQAGITINCDDGVSCTDDSCNEATDSCNNIVNDNNCDDSLYCNGAEYCDATLDCQAVAPLDCSDAYSCTDDSCNEGTDSCDNILNDANCGVDEVCNPIKWGLPDGCGPAPGEWGYPDWQYRKNITIDYTKVTDDLTNFPVLIEFDDVDLAARAQIDGDDILFTSDDEQTQLAHEIELYDSGHLIAWVNVPSVSSTVDTILYMYYGNDTATNQENVEAVWDSNYLAVHHLEETSGDVIDSTSNNNGTPVNGVTQNAVGQIDGGDEFDGVDDRIQLPQVFTSETQFTMEAWMKPGNMRGYAISQWSNYDGAFIQYYAPTNQFQLYIDDYHAEVLGTSNEWHYIVATYNGTTGSLYANAGIPITASASLSWPSQNTYLGDRSTFDRQFLGSLDEIRFSDVVRSEDYIATSYNNQNNPSAFFTLGLEEIGNPPDCVDNDGDGYGEGVDCLDDDCDDTNATINPGAIEVCDGVDNNCDITVDNGGNALCDDSLWCNGAETCAGVSGCQVGTIVDCDDTYSCTDDSCNEGTDSCDNIENNANCGFDEVCDPASFDPPTGCGGSIQCIGQPNETSCDNGIYCDGADECQAQVCVNVGSVVTCDDGLYCNGAETCNEDTDSCDAGTAVDCDNGLYCDGTETCNEVTDSCDAGTAVDCADSVSCTIDSCNEDTDSCDNIVNDGLCDDSLWCNGAEYCDATLDCQAGIAVDCLGAYSCTDDSCNEGTDSCDNIPNDANCGVDEVCNPVKYDLPTGCGLAPGAWGYPNWQYRKNITIDYTKVAEDLTNFPVLIEFNDVDVGNNAQLDGDDILFTGDDAQTQLAHEIEYYNNGNLVAWVKTDLSSSIDTTLYMYYGNSGATNQENVEAVWDSNYLGVYHLDETSGTVYDSTSNNNNGTPSGVTQDVSGQIDGADQFDGNDDRIQLPRVFTTQTQFTIEGWMNAENKKGYAISQWANNQGAFIQYYDPADEFQLYVERYHAGVPGTNNEWYYVVATYDGTTGSLYANAGIPTTVTANLVWPNGNTYLGDRSTFNRQFLGSLDEIRFSDVVRSESYIQTSYNNQEDPSLFFSFGEEETRGTTCTSQPDGTSCDNGLYCDGADECQAEVCVNVGPSINCDDGVSCTDDSCNEAIDSCDYAPTDSLCDDDVFCNGAEYCDILLDCQAAAPLDCSDAYSCTDDSCNGATDSCDNIVNDAYCGVDEVCNPVKYNPPTGCGPAPGGWGYPNWDFRKEIIIDSTKVAEDQTNFPVLIEFDDAQVGASAQTDGDDILFTSDDEQTQLAHEIEYYNNGNLVAWVNVPSLSSSIDTTLYMYYGNSGATNQENVEAVWDSNYLGVYHLDETSGTVYDSTSNNNDGTPSGLTQDAVGQIDGADQFDGSDDRIQLPQIFTTETQFTIEGWMNAESKKGYAISQWANYQGVFIQYYDPADQFQLYVDGYHTEVSGTNNEWYYVVATYDGTTGSLYANAGIPTTVTANLVWPNGNTYLGDRSTFNRQFLGSLDEIRFSDVVRSESYIQTSYNNQDDPSLFFSLSVEETQNTCVSQPDGTPCNNGLYCDGVDECQAEVCINVGPAIGCSDSTGCTIDSCNEATDSCDYVPTDSLCDDGVFCNGAEYCDANLDCQAATALDCLDAYSCTDDSCDEVNDECDNTPNNVNCGVDEVCNIVKYNPPTGCGPAPGGWGYANWDFRKEIIIDSIKVEEDLTNLPVLIDITDADLVARAQTDGDDILFTGDDAQTQLAHEIEYYNNGNLVAWVNVPFVSSTVDTTLYMYYGNVLAANQEDPEGVWDSNYMAVYHLDETSGTVYDSTSNNNDGTALNGVTQNAAGQIDGADQFDGSDDRIQLPQVFSGETQFTIEGWMNVGNQRGYALSQWKNNNGAFIQYYAPTNQFQLYIDDYNAEVSGTSNEWHYIVATYDGTTGSFYANAGIPTTVSASLSWPSQNTYLGDRSTFNRQFLGSLDEIRFSDVARSEDYIQTSYNNQEAPSSFSTIGAEEANPDPDSCVDDDGDDYGVCPGCGIANNCTYEGNDCDDTNIDVNPGGTEVCDNLMDDDCDGFTDGEDSNCGGVTITYPEQYVIFQADGSDQGDITIRGTYTGIPITVEARYNGGTWEVIDASPSGNTFSGTLANQDIVQGILEVRITGDSSASDSVKDIGIGDVFVIAGQSNAEGVAPIANCQTLDPLNTYKATMYREDDDWNIMSCSIDSSREPLTTRASPFIEVANHVIQNVNRPMAFITTATGGSDIYGWQKGQSNYENMINQIDEATDGTMKVKAILFHQGESETNNESTYRDDYKNYLTQFASDAISDTQIAEKVIVAQIGHVYVPTTGTSRETVDAVRKAQQEAWIEDNDVFFGPTLYDVDLSDEGGDRLHFRTVAELQLLADRWWAAINYHLYDSNADGKGPKITGITATDDVVTLTFDEDSTPLIDGSEGYRIETETEVLTDANIIDTTINTNEIILNLDTNLTGNVNLSLGSFNDGAGKDVAKDNSDNNLPAWTIFGFDVEVIVS